MMAGHGWPAAGEVAHLSTSSSPPVAAEPARGRRQAGRCRWEAGPGGLQQIVSSIGPKLRELRAAGSVPPAAGRPCRRPAAAIHKIERSGMVPTITTLLKIAGALNRPVSYFVNEDQTENRPVASSRRRPPPGVHRTPGHRPGRHLRSLRPVLHGRSAVSEVQPGASSGHRPMEHAGRGARAGRRGRVRAGRGWRALRAGGGRRPPLRTDRPHRWRNPGETPTRRHLAGAAAVLTSRRRRHRAGQAPSPSRRPRSTSAPEVWPKRRPLIGGARRRRRHRRPVPRGGRGPRPICPLAAQSRNARRWRECAAVRGSLELRPGRGRRWPARAGARPTRRHRPA